MIRQRVNLRTSALTVIVRLLTLVFALALFWYGLMVVLLALKVAPHTVNAISAYRTLYHDAAGLRARDFTTTSRLIAGFAGLVGFLVLIIVARYQLPRPYLARGELALGDSERGRTLVEPRAVERAVETAAALSPGVTRARGRLGDGHLSLSIDVARAGAVADTLRDTRRRAREALERHDLPALPVNVTVTGYERKHRRELA